MVEWQTRTVQTGVLRRAGSTPVFGILLTHGGMVDTRSLVDVKVRVLLCQKKIRGCGGTVDTHG